MQGASSPPLYPVDPYQTRSMSYSLTVPSHLHLTVMARFPVAVVALALLVGLAAAPASAQSIAASFNHGGGDRGSPSRRRSLRRNCVMFYKLRMYARILRPLRTPSLQWLREIPCRPLLCCGPGKLVGGVGQCPRAVQLTTEPHRASGPRGACMCRQH